MPLVAVRRCTWVVIGEMVLAAVTADGEIVLFPLLRMQTNCGSSRLCENFVPRRPARPSKADPWSVRTRRGRSH